MKIFISQPMKDKTDEQNDAKPLWFLGESFKKLSEADVCIFAKGWKRARGCRLEHKACLFYEIAIKETT